MSAAAADVAFDVPGIFRLDKRSTREIRESVQDMPDQQELEIQRAQLSVRQQELEIERDRIAVEFAKYGFAGTLTAALVGSVVILGLAILNAFTTFKIETWGLVAIGVIILIGSVAFGYLSLWQIPRIVARFRGAELRFNNNSRTQKRPADR